MVGSEKLNLFVIGLVCLVFGLFTIANVSIYVGFISGLVLLLVSARSLIQGFTPPLTKTLSKWIVRVVLGLVLICLIAMFIR